MLYQKFALYALIVVGLSASTATLQARLGETREQTDQRYGTVVHIDNHQRRDGNPRPMRGLFGPTVRYEKSSLTITCYFHKDEVRAIFFRTDLNLDLLDMKRAEQLLAANAEGNIWSKVYWTEEDLGSSGARDVFRYANWVRSDGGSASLSMRDAGPRTLRIHSPWTAERLAALEKLYQKYDLHDLYGIDLQNLPEERDSNIEKYKQLTASGDISDF